MLPDPYRIARAINIKTRATETVIGKPSALALIYLAKGYVKMQNQFTLLFFVCQPLEEELFYQEK